MTPQPWTIEATYDRVAQQYAEELLGLPAERLVRHRQLLDDFAERVQHQGMVCDLGCGPGHMTRYLKDCGMDVCGVDLSAAMIQLASQQNPDIAFHKGDMRCLDFPSESFAGIVAFYSIINRARWTKGGSHKKRDKSRNRA